MPDLSDLRDSMAIAIARRLVDGEKIEQWMLDQFADVDSDLRHAPTLHVGAGFGL